MGVGADVGEGLGVGEAGGGSVGETLVAVGGSVAVGR